MYMSLKDAPDYTQLSDVTITGTEIMVAMDLQGATIAMPIDVQGSTIAIPVDIQGQTISLDVNIAGQIVTVDMNIKGQIVDIKLSGVFQAYQILDKIISAGGIPVGTEDVELINYTVPSGKRLVIMKISVNIAMVGLGQSSIGNRYPSSGYYPTFSYSTDNLGIQIMRGTTILYRFVVPRRVLHLEMTLPTPLIFSAGQTLKVIGWTSTCTTMPEVVVHGYEEAAR